jgi:hypothetical protein
MLRRVTIIGTDVTVFPHVGGNLKAPRLLS